MFYEMPGERAEPESEVVAMRRTLIAGNWKMNGSQAEARRLVADLARRIEPSGGITADYELLICPPFVFLPLAHELARESAVVLGGQDCHSEQAGAHTGDISAAMLAAIGCRYVIVGHSERRQNHGEGNDLVRARAAAALEAGLTPLICVGETREDRDAGRALAVIEEQLRASLPMGSSGPTGESGRVVVAYEPVWAIGTGLTATPADVAEVHAHLRRILEQLRGVEAAASTRILYGGSVNPSNAAQLLALG